MLASLVVIGGVCGALLVGTHTLTADEIRLNREAEARSLMTDMLGTALPAQLDIQADLFGTCEDWLFQRVRVDGYAGDIELLVLRRPAGGQKMRVTAHRETPGIGDFIDHRRDPWITALDGMSAAEVAAIDAVSGATITTNALRNAAARAARAAALYCNG